MLISYPSDRPDLHRVYETRAAFAPPIDEICFGRLVPGLKRLLKMR